MVTLQCLDKNKLGESAATTVSTPPWRETGKDAAIAHSSWCLSAAMPCEEETGKLEEGTSKMEEHQREVKQIKIPLKVDSTCLTLEAEIDELLFSPEVSGICEGVVGEGVVTGVMTDEGVVLDEVMDECVVGETREADEGLETLLGLNPEDFSFSVESSVQSPLTETCCVRGCDIFTSSAGPTSTSVMGEEGVKASGIGEGVPSEHTAMAPDGLAGMTVNSIPESPVASPSPLPPETREIRSFSPLPEISEIDFSPEISGICSSPEISRIRLLGTPSPTCIRSASTPFKAPPPPHVSRNAATEHLDYPINTFYGLPVVVQNLLENHRGIKKLYGKGCHVRLIKPSSLSCVCMHVDGF